MASVSVKSSSGGRGIIQLTEIRETINRLKRAGVKIGNNVDKAIIVNAAKLAKEIELSIGGKRAEPKSFDTGLFANSIEVYKKKKMEAEVRPRSGVRYLDGTKIEDVAKWMEFGTSGKSGDLITPRKHFANSSKRMRYKVVEDLNRAVKQSIS
mgnify:CR=1 FL=1